MSEFQLKLRLYEYDLQNYEQDEWIFAAAMGGYFESREAELGLRDYDKNHDWSIGLLHYPNIKHGKGFMHALQQNPLNSELPQSSLVLPLSDLSLEQRRAHDLIIMALVEKKPIRLIVCGGAGTGKSTLINAVVRSTTTMFGNNKTVRVMAPTGVAAFNIGGSTIHHELAISTDNNADYKPLESEQSRRMQEEFKDTKLIIIGEYIMVGKRMLANVDRRCRDIFASKEYFGNVSIVLFGDIRKLPPVFDSSLYAEKGNTMQHFGAGSYMCFDKCICLSQVFRQSGEEQQAFREALERLSIGDSTMEDWKLFQSRDYAMLKLEEKNEFRNALRLFPRRASAEEYNLKHLKELGNPVARIVSINNCETTSNATSEHAKGLESVICLSVGARVMLRANVATSYGLVNGAMGTVKDIVYSSDGKSPTHMPLAVMVEFDMYDGPSFSEETRILPITPMTCHWKSSSGISCQRTQIPLVLCWACTVHKSQGLTLPKALVDIGESERLGMTFVALSRTKKLSDMAFSPMFSLQRLQRVKTCSGLIRRMKEEERLRRLSYFSY